MDRLKPRSTVWCVVLVVVGSCTTGSPGSAPPTGAPVLDAGQSGGMGGLPTGMLPDGSDTSPTSDASTGPTVPDDGGMAMQDGNVSQADVGGSEVGAVGGCTSQFCETFEEYQSGAAPDPATWTLDGSPVVIDSVNPHNGKLALHVPPHNGALCTDGTAKCLAARFIRLTGAFPAALHKQFYGRVFFYIEQQAGGGFYHWTVMEAGAGTSYSSGLAVRMGGHIQGGEFLRFHMDTHNKQVNPFEYGLSDTQAMIKPKTWYCLEWYYDAPGNEAKFWLDGTERPALHYKGPMGGQPQFNFPPEFQSVAFGWRVYQTSTQPFEVFVDDIALGAQKIGCN